jgi:DNA-binding NarL/FixJ family response regulator
MVDFTILSVTGNLDWIQKMKPDLHATGGTRVVVTRSIGEACELLDTTGARLVLVDWEVESVSCELLDRLLWTNSTLSRPAAVLVVSEIYRPELAVTLFRMGVDEYLSRADHAGQFQPILSHLLAREPETGVDLERSLAVSEPASSTEFRPSTLTRMLALGSTG